MSLDLTSSAFQEGGTIPKKYTCEGADVSPPLQWGDPPAGTRSYALIADDPDAPAGTWVHWVLYNLPADLRGLAEGIPSSERLPNGALHGMTDFRRVGYGGPCPPPGKPHRYYFRLYALDLVLPLQARATKSAVFGPSPRPILPQGQLMGRYARGSRNS